ncbi:MAG: 3-hydroxyacyl-CoA dehydrogenase [Bacteroidetes bacterium]|nr:3-hydroxyacyl-CoA dehydrogenase [Bacteroidota bacterium]
MKKYVCAHDWQREALMQVHQPALAHAELLPADEMPEVLSPGDLLLDLAYEAHPQRLPHYLGLAGVQVVLGNLLHPLYMQVAAAGVAVQCQLYGINALPRALERTGWEVCAYGTAPQTLPLSAPLHWVADQVGLVTPRVLAMIINEAYYMLQEGTADAQAIDTAMLLGVNYPQGPLAWAQEIGPAYVARLLMALHRETGLEKYAPCRLLKTTLAAV